MPRKERPVKIKRYKNRNNRNMVLERKIKYFATIFVRLVLVVGAGYFLGRPLVNMLSGKIKTEKPAPQSSQVSSQTTSETDEVPEAPVNTPEGEIVPAPAKTRIYYYAQPSTLYYEDGMKAQVAAAKQAGATCFVFDLKDSTGNILYSSQNQYASKLKSQSRLDLPLLVKTLSENGLVPVARIYTFMDQMISGIERQTAVMYQGTDTRWLDSSVALGGKAWANPANAVMQQYILDLVDEIMSMGVNEFIFAGFSTPTGYSLDKRDFGVPMDTVLANMKSLISTLKGKISAKGGFAMWQIDYRSIAPDGSYRQYIIHPYQLGADNFLVLAKSDVEQGAVVTQLENAVKDDDVKSITLWVQGAQDTSLSRRLGSYFIN